MVTMMASAAHAKVPPELELFPLISLTPTQEAKLVEHVEAQAKIIFGEHYLRTEVLSLGLRHTYGQTKPNRQYPDRWKEVEIVEPTKVIMIFFKPLPPPRDPVPMAEVRRRLSQPFRWPDGRQARLNLQGKQKTMTPEELEAINKAAEADVTAGESKVGLVPGVVELRPNPRDRSI